MHCITPRPIAALTPLPRLVCARLLMLALGLCLLAVLVEPALAGPSDDAALSRRPSKQAVRQQLDEILAQDEYQTEEQAEAWWFKPMVAAIRFLGKLLERIFRARDTLYVAYPLVFWTVVVLLTAIALGILAHIYMTLTGAFGSGRSRRGLAGVELPPRHSPGDLRARARQAAERGDLGQAIVYLYLAILLHLDRQGLIVFNRADTNRQILRQLSGDVKLVATMEPLTNTVDAISYSSYVPTDAEFARVEQISEVVMAR